MDKISHQYLDRFMVVVIDNIYSYSLTKEAQYEQLDIVLMTFREYKLYDKLRKCEFWDGESKIFKSCGFK